MSRMRSFDPGRGPHDIDWMLAATALAALVIIAIAAALGALT